MDRFPVERIPRDVPPPEKRRPPRIPFLKLLPGETIKGFIVSQQLVRTEVHYWFRRTAPHTEPAEACEPCKLGWQKPRWYGYCILQLGKGRLAIASLTPCAMQSCPRLQDKTLNLRGSILTLHRDKRSAQGELSAQLQDSTPTQTLHADMPLWDILLNIWGVHPDFPPLQREPGERFKNRFRDHTE